MSRRKAAYRMGGPSKDPSKHNAPYWCKWWETVTDKRGTRQVQRTRWFKTKAAAKKHGAGIEARAQSDTRAFTDEERLMVLHFFSQCEARQLDPRTVFGAGLASFGGDEIKELRIESAPDLFCTWAMSKKHSPKTIKGMECTINWLIRQTAPDRLLNTFTAAELNELINQRYTNHVSKNSFQRNIKSFFSWAAQNQYCSAALAPSICFDGNARKSSARESANRRTHKRPQRFTVDQVRTVLESAERRFVPVFALGIFAGLRPETELMNICWAMNDGGHFYGINFEQRIIHLHETWVSKTFMERTITDLPESFWRIMEAHRPADGGLNERISPVNYTNWRKLALLPARAALGFDRWPTDIMRHTACSYNYVLIGKALAMSNAGHKQASTFDTHYLNAVSSKEAREFGELEISGLA